jgi:fatty acid desaturase
MHRKSIPYSLTRKQLIVELVRPWLLLTGYIAAASYALWWMAVPLAIATCLAGFVQMHDAIHRSLGLSKKTNGLLLTLSALLLLKSGHSLQATHLRHHGQCLSDNDPEGEPARWTLRKVLLNGPYHIFSLRFASVRMAPSTRTKQLTETAVTASMLAGFILLFLYRGSMIALVYWGVAFLLSCLMPLWASYIPHKIASRNPVRLSGARMSRIWTPVISSFAFHHFHHTYPDIPTALLPKAIKELPAPEEHHHR